MSESESVVNQLGRIVGRDGFAVVPRAADEEELSALCRALDAVGEGEGVRRRGGVYAVRNLLETVPRVAEFAASPRVRALVGGVLGPGCFAVRGILFDKTREAAWKVAWHQDLTVAVRARRDAEGFRNWTEKAGVAHVQPPDEILARMLTLRLHLDECGDENGPLKVVPGSHLSGRLSAAEAERLVRERPPVTCLVPRGGALLMRPLLLHSSPTPTRPGRRRVVHLEFAAEPLPGGLEWRA